MIVGSYSVWGGVLGLYVEGWGGAGGRAGLHKWKLDRSLLELQVYADVQLVLAMYIYMMVSSYFCFGCGWVGVWVRVIYMKT